MATVYASDSGYARRYRVETWSTSRNHTTANAVSSTVSKFEAAIRTQHFSGRGADVYYLGRSFFYFDTSGITGTVSAATLKIRGFSVGSADVIAVKSDAFGGDGGTALALTDYNNLDFSTAYSAELATWSTSGYNDITLNATALGDMKNNNAFIVAVIEHDHDYADSAPATEDFGAGCYFDPQSGTSYDPYIDYTVATGYGNKVIGMGLTAGSKVNGVDMANISKVIGV